MNKEEAIKFLKQLYPNGGHCWLDEQRMEAIGMAIKALQEVSVSNDKVIYKEKLHQILSSLWINDDKDGKIYYNKALQDVQMSIDLQEEPVSEELEDFAKRQADEFAEREYEGGSYDRGCLSKGYYFGCKAGAKWNADQFEKERLKHCDALTKEQAQIESDFVVDFIKKNNRTPTFIDAIEYGMKLKLKDKK